MLDKEVYFRSVKSQFRDDIKMILNQGHNKKTSRFDFSLLYEKLSNLEGYAYHNGISEIEWLEMVYDLAPQVYDHLYCAKKAA